ncbi:MAG: hypothetical protein U5L72_09675 [Bacteroidales bacterium]|nr:hypothetical protein [Bacteroidales bacterium]
MSMFCFQCQETAKGTGCVVKGVCGKTDDVAQAQDLLVWVAKGISILGTIARENRYSNAKVDRFVQEALFTTITNANFDKARIYERINEGIALREKFIVEMKGHGITIPWETCTQAQHGNRQVSRILSKWLKRLDVLTTASTRMYVHCVN